MIYCLCRGSTGGRDLCHSRAATSATCWFRSAPRQHEGPALLSPVCCWSGCSTGNVVWESRDSDAIAGTSDVFLWILKFYAWLTLTVPVPFPWGLPMPDPWSRTCPGQPWDLLSRAQDSLALWCPGRNSVVQSHKNYRGNPNVNASVMPMLMCRYLHFPIMGGLWKWFSL